MRDETRVAVEELAGDICRQADEVFLAARNVSEDLVRWEIYTLQQLMAELEALL